MSDVLYRTTMYMNAGDALVAREEKPKKRERQEKAWQDKGRKTTGLETGERIGVPNPLLEGSQTSPR